MFRCMPIVGAATVLALACSWAGQASAEQPHGSHAVPHATARARAAGIHQLGAAYMGWSLRGPSEPSAPQQRSGSLPRPAQSSPAAVKSLPHGVDVSAWNTNVDWASLRSNGSRFAFIKASEGNYYASATFTTQYHDAAKAGLIRGAYHFANPSVSSGTSQARYFVNHGGAWSPGDTILPGVLDIEYNPYGPTCYGKNHRQMTSWIASFTHEYAKLTGRDPIIYTTYQWWNQCTGNTSRFNTSDPLWIARYQNTAGTLPGRWPFYTFWQYTSSLLDQDVFNGNLTGLKNLARGHKACKPPIHKPKRLRVLHYGMSGADVRYAQKLLNRLGDHLATDGDFGPATRRAVKAFQREEHIVVDGIVGPITWSHLRSAAKKKTC